MATNVVGEVGSQLKPSDQTLGRPRALVVLGFENMFDLIGGISQPAIGRTQQERESDDRCRDHQELVPAALVGQKHGQTAV